jgi:hypothetical protein
MKLANGVVASRCGYGVTIVIGHLVFYVIGHNTTYDPAIEFPREVRGALHQLWPQRNIVRKLWPPLFVLDHSTFMAITSLVSHRTIVEEPGEERASSTPT